MKKYLVSKLYDPEPIFFPSISILCQHLEYIINEKVFIFYIIWFFYYQFYANFSFLFPLQIWLWNQAMWGSPQFFFISVSIFLKSFIFFPITNLAQIQFHHHNYYCYFNIIFSAYSLYNPPLLTWNNVCFTTRNSIWISIFIKNDIFSIIFQL